MMTTLFAAAAILGAQEAPTQWKGPDLVSRMLTTYHNRRSADGTITLVITAANQGIRVNTQLSYLMPSRLYLNQRSEGRTPRSALVISDGKQFMYPAPRTSRVLNQSPFVYERVESANGKLQLVGDIYGAASSSLVDRSIPLDIVINRRSDLEYMALLLTNLRYTGKKAAGSVEWHTVEGNIRLSPADPPSNRCRFWIDDEFHLRRFETEETYKADDGVTNITTVWRWDLNITLDEVDKIDRNRFTIRR